MLLYVIHLDNKTRKKIFSFLIIQSISDILKKIIKKTTVNKNDFAVICKYYEKNC